MTPEEIINIVDSYMDYMKKKRLLLGKFLEHTNRALNLVTSEQEEDINAALNSREELIKEIDDLDKQNSETKKILHDLKLQGLLKDLPEIEKVNSAARKVLKDIVDKDIKLREMAAERKKDLSLKLKQLKDGRKINSAYANSIPLSEGVFVDFRK